MRRGGIGEGPWRRLDGFGYGGGGRTGRGSEVMEVEGRDEWERKCRTVVEG